MARNTRNSGRQPTPVEPTPDKQQMQDDGSQDAETFANIEPDGGAQSFANINPADK